MNVTVVDSPDGVLRLDGDLPAPPRVIFAHFTKAELLTRWWAETAATDPRVGGSYEVAWPSHDYVLTGKYLEFEPGKRLKFTWSFAHQSLPPSTVDIRLSSLELGCAIVIEHTYTEAKERSEYLDGWQVFIGRLAELLTDAA